MTRTNPPATLRLPATRRAVPTRTRLRTRRLPLVAYALVLLVLPAAVIVTAHTTGWWVTNGHTVTTDALGADTLGVARPSGGGAGGTTADTAGGTTGGGAVGTAATTANAHDVKGSMTLQQLLDAFPQVSAADVCHQF